MYQCKLDLKDAFKHFVVRPDDWDLLGSTWNRGANGCKVTEYYTEYYIDMVLPFGCRSSPQLFDNFGSGLNLLWS